MPWWGALALTLLAVLTLVGVITAMVAIRAAAHGLTPEEAAPEVVGDPLNLAAVQAAAFGLAIFVGLALFQRGVRLREALALGPVGIPTLALALLAGFALQFPLAEVANLAQEVWPVPIEEQIRQHRLVTPDGPLDALLVVLAVVVVAATTEELLFRGLMLPSLADRYGPGFALVASSLLFGLMHQQPAAMVYASIAGLLLGAVVIRTGSTWPALAMHAANNAVPVMLPQSVIRIEGFNTISQDVYHLPLPLLVGASVVAAAALAGMARLEDPDRG